MKQPIEILRKHLSKGKNNPEDTFYTQSQALKAMEEYANQFKNERVKSDISGCFIVNNEKSPEVSKHYKVIYTDGTYGMEYFDGNTWVVKYNHPVKMWWLILK